jgi:uncharacterized NAD-dependent epimerase/dehydratase family protein
MHVLPPYSRILVLTEGRLGVFTSKTAAALLRYRASDVVGLIDSTRRGQDVRTLIPWSPAVPIYSNIEEALTARPQALFIGVAPAGGVLPAEMRAHVQAALRAGLDIVNGLHTRLAADPQLRRLAAQRGARVVDLREPPTGQTVAAGRARTTRCLRVLTVGSDCNVGKMVAAWELAAAARNRGYDARFIATGQTGIMIAGRGVVLDAMVADFVAGAAEQLVLEAGDADLCFVEGQGSLAHPGFSGVALSLLHGVCPDALVLVHHAGRSVHRGDSGVPIPPLSLLKQAYERAAELLHPARVMGVLLNTVDLDERAAHEDARRIEGELALPVQDAIRTGCERVLDAVLAEFSREKTSA